VLLEQLGKVCDTTRRIGQGEKTWLGIGFAPSTLYGVLPELIRRLRNHDALELELGLSEMTTLQQVEALKAGRIDVGFGRIRIDDPAIVQRVLSRTAWCGVARRPRLAGRARHPRPIGRRAVCAVPRQPAAQLCRPCDRAVRRPRFEPQGGAVDQRVADRHRPGRAGMGVTLVPASVQVLHRADIAYTPVVEATATSPIILSRRVNDQSPGLNHCLQLVEELI